MSSSFEAIISAAQKAQAQFSVTQGKQSDNEEVVREFAIEAMKAIAGLVFEAGGDPDYVETWIDGIGNDIDLSFQSAREPVVTPVFRPRRGLGLVVGASMGEFR
jgi:hypothetical protein